MNIMTKPFCLEKALAGHPVVAKNGKRVIRMAHFPEAPLPMFRLEVLLEGENYPLSYSEQGRKYADSDVFGYDLLLEVKAVKRWARMEITRGFPVATSVHKSRESAESSNDYDHIFEYEVEE